jgi:hypothetical protein
LFCALGPTSRGESLKKKAKSWNMDKSQFELQFGPFQYEDHFNMGPVGLVFFGLATNKVLFYYIQYSKISTNLDAPPPQPTIFNFYYFGGGLCH